MVQDSASRQANPHQQDGQGMSTDDASRMSSSWQLAAPAAGSPRVCAWPKVKSHECAERRCEGCREVPRKGQVLTCDTCAPRDTLLAQHNLCEECVGDEGELMWANDNGRSAWTYPDCHDP
jgi:hypothetical protein